MRSATVSLPTGRVFLQTAGPEESEKYFAEAEALDPANWNIHRQDWALTDKKSQSRNWMTKVAKSKKPYYAPLDLPK